MSRIRRIKGNYRFDRSMRGDLDHAISMETYQVRLSQLGRWNILPIGILIVLVVWEGGKSFWIAVGILTFLALANYAAGWEHSIYKARKRELEILQHKLEYVKGVTKRRHNQQQKLFASDASAKIKFYLYYYIWWTEYGFKITTLHLSLRCELFLKTRA